MNWNFRSDQPIYTQLMDEFTRGVVSGALAPGARLPSVRELASEAGVNPNTMQRALQELEREGLVFSQRTLGRFVTQDTEKISAVKRTVAQAEIQRFLSAMAALGYQKEEIKAILNEEEK